MEDPQYKISDFEGPLDLLLHLISKNKMNIYDIEILILIDQYVATVGALTNNSIESASAFIEMAARLVQMKSVYLLHKDDEAERMCQELTGQLIEYSVCKAVAQKLKAMAENVFIVVREPVDIQFDTSYRLQHDVQMLADAYAAMAGRGSKKRAPRQEQFDTIVQAPFVSVSSRIVHVLRGLVTGKVRWLRELFAKGSGRSQTVATFLAVLELVRAGRITITEDEELTVAAKPRKSNADNGGL